MNERQQVIEQERQLIAAVGRILPIADAALLADAEALCADTPQALDPDNAGRHKWHAGGSFYIASTLAAAYEATRDDRYVRTADAWFNYWLETQHYLTDAWQPDDGLTTAHRVGDTELPGWMGALPVLVTSDAFPDDLIRNVVAAVQVQMRHLAANPHPYIDNIRMTTHDCLLHTAWRLPFLSDAAAWRTAAVRGLNDLLDRLFHPDGASTEACGWYHYIVANMLRRHWLLQRAVPELGLRVSRDQVAAAFDYLVAGVEPDGGFNRIGDALGSPLPYTTLADVLAYRRQVCRKLGLPESTPPTSQIFTGAGQAVLRSDWSDHATCISFDATPGVPPAWHWHPAANAINVTVGGVRMLMDPGHFTYADSPERRYAISTRAHNTLTLNGWDQAPGAVGPLRHHGINGFDIVDTRYYGGYWQGERHRYTAGIAGEHHRTLLWVRDRCLIVIDHLANNMLETEQAIPCAAHWQCSPGEITIGTRDAVFTREDVSLRLLVALAPADAVLTMQCGDTEPMRGWVDGAHGPVPAPQLTLTVNATAPALFDLVTVLIPGGDTPPPVVCAEAVRPFAQRPGKVVLHWEDGTHDRLYWQRGLAMPLGKVDGMTTDAALLLVSELPAAPARALVYEGSYLSPWETLPREARGTYLLDDPLLQ
jgi:hypothetical protein